uniref:Uncharacterized protein n=1 Tax=Cucumis melo TaxID=3656 RepID=A0A9I9CC65_CUCME
MESLTSLLLLSLSRVNRDWRCWSKSPLFLLYLDHQRPGRALIDLKSILSSVPLR